jgi:hypothetical protein
VEVWRERRKREEVGRDVVKEESERKVKVRGSGESWRESSKKVN